MSEELEGTLREAIEGYLGERLRVISDDLARLQADFNNTISRLQESSAGGSLAGTPLAQSISEHLQTARSQGASDTAATAPSTTGADFATINSAVRAITHESSQVNALGTLLSEASRFAQRTALFVVKNERAVGWRFCGGPAETISDASLHELVLPLTTDTLLSYVARSHTSWSGEPGSNADDNLLLEKLGGAPRRIAAVPLVVRGRTVAVLYADSEDSDPNAINIDALETLVSVAAATVELVSLHRVPKRTGEEGAQAVAEAQAPETVTAPVEGRHQDLKEESQEAPAIEGIAETPTVTEPETQEAAAPPDTETVYDEAITTEIEPPSVTAVDPSVFLPPAEPVISSAPSFGSEFAAPLGTTRRWGGVEADLPIDVNEDERRLHTDARRFARLLVSEIKLYNEQKVKDGRSQGDIYDRLREDIDRSRQMYEKRIAPPVASRYDYFHQELVKTLADGDSSKLGVSYPGESVVVT